MLEADASDLISFATRWADLGDAVTEQVAKVVDDPEGTGEDVNPAAIEWIRERGDDDGPLFCPVSQTGIVRISRMRGESISSILRRRQQAAGVEAFSPHDLRRTNISELLANGADLITVQQLAGVRPRRSPPFAVAETESSLGQEVNDAKGNRRAA